jgi:hypothetical protein
MDGPSRRARTLLGAAGAALAPAGPVMLLRGGTGRNGIRAEPAAREITFPERRLPVEPAAHAGRRVPQRP